MPNPGVQRIVTAAVLLIAAAGAASPSRAQTSAAQPAFDVASVKLNASGDWRKSLGPAPGGRFLATNQTLRDLMPFAYGLPQIAADIRIVGGPSWIDSDRFDIVAKSGWHTVSPANRRHVADPARRSVQAVGPS